MLTLRESRIKYYFFTDYRILVKTDFQYYTSNYILDDISRKKVTKIVGMDLVYTGNLQSNCIFLFIQSNAHLFKSTFQLPMINS